MVLHMQMPKFVFTKLVPATSYTVYCASQVHRTLSFQTVIQSGGSILPPTVMQRHAVGGTIQVVISTKEIVQCVADVNTTTAVRTLSEVFNNQPSANTPAFAEAPLAVTSVSNAATIIKFTALSPMMSYHIYCATVGVLLDPRTPLATVGFLSTPQLVGSVATGGFSVRTRINDNNHGLRCCAYPQGTSKPYPSLVANCENAVAGGLPLVDVSQSQFWYSFHFKGLQPATTYTTFCATSFPNSVGAVSNSVDATTASICAHMRTRTRTRTRMHTHMST